VKQDFHGNSQVNVMFFLFSLVSSTDLSLFWHGMKDLFTLLELADKVILDPY